MVASLRRGGKVIFFGNGGAPLTPHIWPPSWPDGT